MSCDDRDDYFLVLEKKYCELKYPVGILVLKTYLKTPFDSV